MAFDHSRRRWFGICSCKPIPRGQPSSAKQLRTSLAYSAVLVLVAHCSRYTVQVNSCPGGTNANLRFRGYTPTEIFVIVLCCLSCGHDPVMTKPATNAKLQDAFLVYEF